VTAFFCPFFIRALLADTLSLASALFTSFTSFRYPKREKRGTELRNSLQVFVLGSPFTGEMSEGQRGVFSISPSSVVLGIKSTWNIVFYCTLSLASTFPKREKSGTELRISLQAIDFNES